MTLIAGNSFGKSESLPETRAKARLIFDMYQLMHATAYGPGADDLLVGLDFLGTLDAAYPDLLVSANIHAAGNKEPYFRPYRLIEAGGRKILVTSVLDPGLVPDFMKDIAVSDPVAALNSVMNAAPHDVFIVILQAPLLQTKQWLHMMDGIDIVVLGNDSGILFNKEYIDETVVLANNKQGAQAAFIDVVLTPDGRVAFDKPNFVLLGASEVADDPDVSNAIAEYKKHLDKFRAERLEKRMAGKKVVPHDGLFVGDAHCVRCHRNVMASWRETRHAHAFETLLAKDKARDASCLMCHVVGINLRDTPFIRAKGGYTSPQITPHLMNVQCEACHGPGMAHVHEPERFTFPEVSPTTCKRCHTTAQDQDFAFLRDVHLGTHEMGLKIAEKKEHKDAGESK